MADKNDTDAQVRRAMRRLQRSRAPPSPEEEAIQRERREFLRLWKLKWSRLLRRRMTDRHIAELIGLTAGTVKRKRNGKIRISRRMKPALTNIDTVIDANRMPDGCPQDLRPAIISYQTRHPLDRR